MKITLRTKSFKGHKGIPGHRGGSLSRADAGSTDKLLRDEQHELERSFDYLRTNTNSWAVRDNIKTLSNKYLDTKLYTIDKKTALKNVAKLQKIMKLDMMDNEDFVILDIASEFDGNGYGEYPDYMNEGEEDNN
jgi:hypothetical protein